MPDWYGTTGRDDLVGGGGETQYSTTIGDITLCSVKPFSDEEVAALREYFALLEDRTARLVVTDDDIADYPDWRRR